MIDTPVAARRILVCDDDDDIRVGLDHSLRDSGYDVVATQNGTELFDAVRERPPDVILLDIRMPEQDGFDIAEALQRGGVRIPIIFMTAYDNAFCRGYAAALNRAAYLTKPFDFDRMLSEIERVMKPRSPPDPT